jgi:signal transduction histidine kinase
MSDQDELTAGPALARHVTRHWLDAWERREMPVFTALPYGMLGFCAILIIVLRNAPGTRWLAGLGLCGVALAWLLIGAAAGATIGTAFRPAHGPSWRGRPWMRVVFVAGLATIMIVMVIGSPLFGFFTFTGYLYAAQLPSGWWRAAGVVAISVPTGASQAGGFATAAAGSAGAAIFAGAIAVNVVVAGAFMWFGWVGTMQSERRVRLVEELSEANRRLEATLAENATLHEKLVVQAREAGVLDERQRMAREIHDTIAQGLTGIITQLQAAREAAGDAGEQQRHFDAATRLARESLTEARRSVDALRPEPLEGTRLAEAVVSVADRWSALHGVPAQVVVTGAVRPLPAETEVVLLRAAQEALANVAKHAGASHAWLTLSYMDCEVALDVRDDGRGFDPAGLPATAEASTAAGGFGLMAMRQRVEGLSGTLQLESEPGGGTVISACVPDGPAQPGAAGDRAGPGDQAGRPARERKVDA